MKDDLLLEDASFELMPEFGRIRGRRPAVAMAPRRSLKLSSGTRPNPNRLGVVDRFDSGGYLLKWHHFAQMREASNKLPNDCYEESARTLPPIVLDFLAYSDNTRGDSTENYDLGYRRSMEVRNFFMDSYCSPDQTPGRKIVVGTIISAGPDYPVAPNTTADGRARNRRVEIWLSDLPPSTGSQAFLRTGRKR